LTGQRDFIQPSPDQSSYKTRAATRVQRLVGFRSGDQRGTRGLCENEIGGVGLCVNSAIHPTTVCLALYVYLRSLEKGAPKQGLPSVIRDRATTATPSRKSICLNSKYSTICSLVDALSSPAVTRVKPWFDNSDDSMNSMFCEETFLMCRNPE
jgi:hypothetical protein